MRPPGKKAGVRVAIIWQRFLSYHIARLFHLQRKLQHVGHSLSAVQIASQDSSYLFPEDSLDAFDTAFPGKDYHNLSRNQIYNAALEKLRMLRPDVVFAPATAFPEGMAAFRYRLESGCRAIMMDDAWEWTDRKGGLTRQIKKIIHQNIDGVFIPAPSHMTYYESLGFPLERVIYGVDVVDNEYFSRCTDDARRDAVAKRRGKGLPEKYFLFVGRFLPRKGLEMLVAAYEHYRKQSGNTGWDLVLVGGGPHQEIIRERATGIPGIHFSGVLVGDDLCLYYGLAQALIVPSVLDPWGLVVNEGMASGLPVLVSRGCGAAQTLVKEGENGWTFALEDVEELAELMHRLSVLPDEACRQMGERSREIIADWSLDRFADGVVLAMAVSRRAPAGMVANLATRIWKGRVTIN